MIDPKLLAMLRCPVDAKPLTIADSKLIDQINASISAGEARDCLDQAVSEPIDGGLVSGDGSRVYPIRGGIPTLIADEAIRV